MSVQKKRSGDPAELLRVAAEVLAANPGASLGDVAAAAGVGRTTLHTKFPTREALLLALAHDSLELCAVAAEEAGISDPAADSVDVLTRLVDALIPLGPRIDFLLQQPTLDLDAEVERLDAPIEDFVRRAQQAGVISPDLPPWWVVSTIYALTYSAWDNVARGALAPRAAGPLTLRTLLNGVSP